MRTLKEFRTYPDNQRWTCSDQSVADRHKLQIPFECGCRQWMGGGCVKVEFYSMRDLVHVTCIPWQSSDYADIQTLKPIEGQTWEFDPMIEI